MPDKPTLLDTLEITRGLLAACRKVVSDNGHLGDMQDIDTLINVSRPRPTGAWQKSNDTRVSQILGYDR